MSGEVKRWNWHEIPPFGPGRQVVPASDYEDVVREREQLTERNRFQAEWLTERLAELTKAQNDRDRYKAMVERVKAHVLCVYGTLARSHLNDVLSELPGTRCRHCNAEFECLDALAHGFGRCVERRKIERRQYRACVHARHSPLTIPTIRCNETTRKRDRRA